MDGHFLSQSAFDRDIISRADMLSCNPCNTLTNTKPKLSPHGTPVADPALYRSLAGALQYLTFTHPDIPYAAQQICLFMHDPREPHFLAFQRILRYIQGKLSHELRIRASSIDHLVAYSDADCVGCPQTLGPLPDFVSILVIISCHGPPSVNMLCLAPRLRLSTRE
ncbi:hypothetical protein Lser_V15G32507 [Lactuca serriola]